VGQFRKRSANLGTTCVQGRKSKKEKTMDSSRTRTNVDHSNNISRTITNVAIGSGTTK